MPKSESFLETYFSDCQAEMRWRREVEYKLISLLVPLCPALIGGLLALSALLPPHTLFATSVALTVFVWALYYYVWRKITAEHAIYQVLGSTVLKIWDYFDFFKKEDSYFQAAAILPDQAKKYGTGLGYKLTLNVFLALSIATTLMLVGIGVFAESGKLQAHEGWSTTEVIRHAIEAASAADSQTKDWLVRSLEWRPDRKEYQIVVLRQGREEGYSLALNTATRILTSFQTTKIQSGTPSNPAIFSTAELQERLHMLGYYRAAIDGQHGPLTKRATRRFQQNHNLDMTGEVDEKTWRALMGYTRSD
jgi:hypothetical protein